MAKDLRLTEGAKSARRMLLGGLALSHLASILAIGLAAWLGGSRGALSALIGFALVIVFFTIGQLVEIVVLELASVAGLVITITNYAVRVIGLGIGLGALSRFAGDSLSPRWLFAGLVAAVLGWIVGIVWVAAKERVPVYDEPYRPPSGWDAGQ